MSLLYCSHCGRQNEPDAIFCEFCGNPIRENSGVPYADLRADAEGRKTEKRRTGDGRGSVKKSPGKGFRRPGNEDYKIDTGRERPETKRDSRVEYLGPMEFDITHTIEDYEYTRRSVRDMNRILDSREFAEMDSETIYQYLLGQMRIVSFKDYLKRYVYERNPQQVPFAKVREETYISIIIDSFMKNHAPGSFNEIEIRWKATVRYWLRKESATRDNVFLLGFGLKMTDPDVSDFLTKVLKEQDFRFHDPRETVFWYAYHYGLEYSEAKKYLDYYDRLSEEDLLAAEAKGKLKIFEAIADMDSWDEDLLTESGFASSGLSGPEDLFTNTNGSFSGEMTAADFYYSAEASVREGVPIESIMGRDIQRFLTDEDKLKEYLAELKVHQDKMPDIISREYRHLYRRAARAAFRIVRIDDEGAGQDRRKARHEATAAEIETILCSGIPKNSAGNLVNVSRSILHKQFQKKRMSRQRISRAMKHSNVIERFDFITLLFLVYAIEVEPDWPVERFMRYIDEINEILKRCNMMSIYPVNPYESFILMCLLTEEPLATYADIWELSFEK